MTLLDTGAELRVARPRDPRDPWQRIEALCDEGSVRTLHAPAGRGVVTATGRVHDVEVVVFASEPTVQGGAMGHEGCLAVASAYDVAMHRGAPVIGIWHSGGARLAEGVASLDGVGRIFAAMTRASGRVPQISVVLGPAAGGAAYGPALTDIVILGPHGRVFVTGPDVVRSVTGEDVDMLRLGGPETHSRKSGVVHITTKDDECALLEARKLTVLLGHQGRLSPADVANDDDGTHDLTAAVPVEANRAYDVKPMV